MLKAVPARPVSCGQHAHLPGDFAGGQMAHEAHLAREAERARHGAAHLRGNAERLRRRVGDVDGLDLPAVLRGAAGTWRCRPTTSGATRGPGCRCVKRAASRSRSGAARSVISDEIGDARWRGSSGRPGAREIAGTPRASKAAVDFVPFQFCEVHGRSRSDATGVPRRGNSAGSMLSFVILTLALKAQA